MANSALVPETLGLSKTANADVLIAAMSQKVFQLPRLNEALCKTENASLIEILNSINEKAFEVSDKGMSSLLDFKRLILSVTDSDAYCEYRTIHLQKKSTSAKARFMFLILCLCPLSL